MTQADLDKWQRRYQAPSAKPGPPEAFLKQSLDGLPQAGQALDIAGGMGRHALALAEHGLHSTLLDVSPRGLQIAQEEAERRGLALETLAWDLDRGLELGRCFDVILLAWFLLEAPLWLALGQILAPGGSLIYMQPTVLNLDRHTHPSARFLVKPGQLARGAATLGLTVVEHQIGWDTQDHHTERLWARKDLA